MTNVMETKIYDFLHEDVVRIRTEVFVEEQQFKEEFDDIDHHCKHFVFYEKDEPVAICRIYPYDEKTYAIGRIWRISSSKKGIMEVDFLNSFIVGLCKPYPKAFCM